MKAMEGIYYFAKPIVMQVIDCADEIRIGYRKAEESARAPKKATKGETPIKNEKTSKGEKSTLPATEQSIPKLEKPHDA